MYLLLLEIYSENYYYDEEVLVLLLGSQCTNWFVFLYWQYCSYTQYLLIAIKNKEDEPV